MLQWSPVQIFGFVYKMDLLPLFLSLPKYLLQCLNWLIYRWTLFFVSLLNANRIFENKESGSIFCSRNSLSLSEEKNVLIAFFLSTSGLDKKNVKSCLQNNFRGGLGSLIAC